MSLISLWLPLLVSAVFVFFVSSFIHMVLPYHRKDYQKLADEDGILNALKDFKMEPGDYHFPHAGNQQEMASDDFKEKIKNGPVGLMTIMKNETPSMVKSLGLWFVFILIVNFFAGYLAMAAVGSDAYYLKVFRFVGTSAFMGYGLALMQSSIWFGKRWSTTFKGIIDALIYALITAGVYGWLWPMA